MKKIIVFIIVLFSSLLFNINILHAQVIVKIRPVPPHIGVRPAMHGRGLIWIEPEWVWNKRQHAYVWREGRWAKPKRHAAWVPGHWVEVQEGYNWVPGYWGRRR